VGTLGNGDGKGYIYIIFLDGPTGNSGRTWQPGIDYIRLDTGTGTVAAPNGMAPPFPADVNADGKVDFIYAGDLLGDFWKFDVSKADPTLWPAATNRVALFSGGTTQPITSMAQGVLHPTGPGFILAFGTGKYLEPSDPIAAASAPFYKNQSFYGIWDKNDGTTSVSTQTVVTNRATQLFQQTINETTVNGVKFRYITGAGGAKGPNWATHLGWFMDFPDSVTTGERNVFDPAISARRLIFTTLIPKTGACDFGGDGYIMVVNPATGGIFDAPVLDANNDGVLNASDAVSGSIFASGVQTLGISMTPTVLTGGVWTQGRTETTLLRDDGVGRVKGGGNRRNTMIVPTVSGTSITMVLGAGPDSGRATWREVIRK
jgi:type IV pilus assembly protein PilY1